MQMMPQMTSEPGTDRALELLHSGPLDSAYRAESGEQCRRATWTDSGDIDELGGEGSFAPTRTVAPPAGMVDTDLSINSVTDTDIGWG